MCSSICSVGCSGSRCDQVTGGCVVCERGWTGDGCDVACPSHCNDQGCNKTNGTCVACDASWYGDYCGSQCSPHCMLCFDATLCQRCEPGWYMEITRSRNQCANCPDHCEVCNNMDDCTTCQDGWVGPRCQCSENCDGGLQKCDQNTGRCTAGCVQNYYGDSCDIQCDACLTCNQSTGVCTSCRPGYFGLQCNETCSWGCSDSPDGEVHCDISRGRCLTSCVTGYSGDTCSVGIQMISNCTPLLVGVTGDCDVCESGWTGDRCGVECLSNCDDQGCDKTSGICVACDLGWYGNKCTSQCQSNCDDQGCARAGGECENCDVGWYGNYCTIDCQSACDDRGCDKTSGDCFGCKTGWIGPRCDTRLCTGHCLDDTCDDSGLCVSCSNGYRGPQCLEKCGTHCGNDGCDRETAVCTGCDTGRHGARCQDVCVQNCVGGCEQYDAVCIDCDVGFYGNFCNLTCDVNCNVNMCHRNGTCTHGCVDGWTAPMCNRQCFSHCLLCSDVALCQRCEPGCMDDCTTCRDGWKGLRCQCSENCDGGLQGCDQNTGRCTAGCVQNYYGDRCDVQCDVCLTCNQSTGVCTSCRHGFFGLQCNETCSPSCSDSQDGEVHCDISSGRCLTPCVTGYSGDTCSVRRDTSTRHPCSTAYYLNTSSLKYGVIPQHVILVVRRDTSTRHPCNAFDPSISVDEGPVVGAAVGGLFGGIVLTAVVAVILVYFWRCGHGNQAQETDITRNKQQKPLPNLQKYRSPSHHYSKYQSIRKSGAHTDDDNNYVNDGESQMYENEAVAVTIPDTDKQYANLP
ncbi:hypothetical protein ScPMuIL_007021 [Solemya velum]